jgi:hypothetical protein
MSYVQQGATTSSVFHKYRFLLEGLGAEIILSLS